MYPIRLPEYDRSKAGNNRYLVNQKTYEKSSGAMQATMIIKKGIRTRYATNKEELDFLEQNGIKIIFRSKNQAHEIIEKMKEIKKMLGVS